MTTMAPAGLSIFEIKVFALAFMTIGHASSYGLCTNNAFVNIIAHFFGKMAAPLFLFALTEGLKHTHSKKHYVIRLYIAFTVTAILNSIMRAVFGAGNINIRFGNIFQTYFFVALYVYCAEMFHTYRVSALCIIAGSVMLSIPVLFWSGDTIGDILNLFIPSLLAVEYSLAFVVLGLIWFFSHRIVIKIIWFIFIGLLSLFVPENGLFSNELFPMLAAIPVLLLYNGQKGKGAKYLFYLYYPTHIYLLAFIHILIF